jgi:hypothetical protein
MEFDLPGSFDDHSRLRALGNPLLVAMCLRFYRLLCVAVLAEVGTVSHTRLNQSQAKHHEISLKILTPSPCKM